MPKLILSFLSQQHYLQREQGMRGIFPIFVSTSFFPTSITGLSRTAGPLIDLNKNEKLVDSHYKVPKKLQRLHKGSTELTNYLQRLHKDPLKIFAKASQ